MNAYTLLAAALQAAGTSDDGLTFSGVVKNLPHDPASLFVLALLVASIAAILWVGRPGRPGSSP